MRTSNKNELLIPLTIIWAIVEILNTHEVAQVIVRIVEVLAQATLPR